MRGYMRLHADFFQPVMKLKEKIRTGARVRKVHDTAGTPCRRMPQSADLLPETRREPADLHLSLDPTRPGNQFEFGIRAEFGDTYLSPRRH